MAIFDRFLTPLYKILFVISAIYTGITVIVSYTESVGSKLFENLVLLIPAPFVEEMYGQRYSITFLFFLIGILYIYIYVKKIRARFENTCRSFDDFQRSQGREIAKVLRKYQQLNKTELSVTAYNTLSKEVDEFLHKFTTHICKTVTFYTGRPCHTAIKTLNKGQVSSWIRENSVSDASRSTIDEVLRSFSYNENSAFEQILEKEDASYYFNNWLRLSHVLKRYKNKNPNWSKSYNATLVVPITLKTHPKRIDQESVWGFICVDNKGGGFDKTSAWILSSYARICFNIFEDIPIVNIIGIGDTTDEGFNHE